MKKVVLASVIAATVVLSPVVAMGISPARDLILGLAPDEAVLKIADTIDTDRVNIEQKMKEKDEQLAELQSANDALSAKVDAQKADTIAQKEDVAKATAAIAAVKNDVADAKASAVSEKVASEKKNDCSKDVAAYCGLKQYRDKDAYSEFKSDTLSSCESSGEPDSSCKSIFDDRYAPNFEKCQKALSC